MELPVTCVDTSTLKRAVDPRCNDLCEMCLDRNGKILGKLEACCIICEHRRAPSGIAIMRHVRGAVEILAADRSIIRDVSFRMIPRQSRFNPCRAIGYYRLLSPASRIALDDLIP
jgi:phage terminase large subunit GpA-like protein